MAGEAARTRRGPRRCCRGSGGCDCRCPGPGAARQCLGGARDDGIVLFDTGMGGEGGCASSSWRCPGRLGARDSGSWSAPTPRRPLRPRGPDRRRRRLRALDPPGLGARAPAGRRPGRALDRRIEVARQSGVPAAALELYREPRRGTTAPASPRSWSSPIASWSPGSRSRPTSAPGRCTRRRATPLPTSSARAGERLLISGDHLWPDLLFFDYGHTPDPVSEFIGGSTRSTGSSRTLCLPATGAPSATPRPRWPKRGASSASNSAGARALRRRRTRTAFELIGDLVGPENLTARPVPGACSSRSPTSTTSPSRAR